MLNKDLLLDAGASVKSYKQGEYIYKEGSRCMFFNQLMHGTVHIINETDEGKEFLHEIVFPENCFGELPLFDDAPYPMTAVAGQGCEVLQLSRDKFRKLLTDKPEINTYFTAHFVKKIRFEVSRLKEISTTDPKHRISSLINYLKDHEVCMNREVEGVICRNCSKLKLTRQQIACMTGLRVETVIRALKKMEESGEVKIIKGKVYTDTELPLGRCTKPE
ncbi:Crp/Fnr family transcriptional regulator [Haoranjiania flava]|uniref:Crp/Fnr family transcriptional regulator n=1 Tax=Haoranjiania flava TaxID=1856322 RepID=A0AAE3IMB4_9BACT|nr:Crp/Fnr family transcriptional regulator [Haoranjiania flava]MCU7694533.1 Crp/Fnr family transcriptional regulator [Haoranjiania flava]